MIDLNAARQKESRLAGLLTDMESVLVSFSGGVDSSYLLKIAVDTLGAKAVAATGLSQTYAAEEMEEARIIATEIGAELRHGRHGGAYRPSLRRQHPPALLLLQDRAVFTALRGRSDAWTERDRRRLKCRRSGRFPARHARRSRSGRAQSVAGSSAWQGRDSRALGAPRAAHVGQARRGVPVVTVRIRRSDHR